MRSGIEMAWEIEQRRRLSRLERELREVRIELTQLSEDASDAEGAALSDEEGEILAEIEQVRRETFEEAEADDRFDRAKDARKERL